MKKIIILLLLISLPSYAFSTYDLTESKHNTLAKMYPGYEELSISNFTDKFNNGIRAQFALKKHKTNKKIDLLYTILIGSTQIGKQRLYIVLPDKCSSKRVLATGLVVKVNKQNILFNKYCIRPYIYITPKTRVGENFLVKQFTKNNFVIFHFYKIDVLFDATGFTNAWANYGGDAL